MSQAEAQSPAEPDDSPTPAAESPTGVDDEPQGTQDPPAEVGPTLLPSEQPTVSDSPGPQGNVGQKSDLLTKGELFQGHGDEWKEALAQDVADPGATPAGANQGGKRNLLTGTPAPSEDRNALPEIEQKPVDEDWFLATGKPAPRRVALSTEPQESEIQTVQGPPAWAWAAAFLVVLVFVLVGVLALSLATMAT